MLVYSIAAIRDCLFVVQAEAAEPEPAAPQMKMSQHPRYAQFFKMINLVTLIALIRGHPSDRAWWICFAC